MERVKKKPTVAELVSEYKMIDRNLGFQILKKVEVRDAMKFVIGVGGDKRYRKILEMMRKELIWKYWMQRDLKIIMDVLQNELPKWITVNPIETVKPQWKLCYLWYRLMVGASQWYQLERLKKKDLDMYPEGSTIEYVNLNVLKLTIPKETFGKAETLLLDFRKEYTRIYPVLENENRAIKYRAKFVTFIDTSFSLFLKNKGYVNIERGLNDYIEVLQNLANVIDIGSHPLSPFNVPYTRIRWKLVAQFPRTPESTTLIVASNICAQCSGPDPGFKCGNECGAKYCDKECQKQHWSGHKQDGQCIY